MEKGKSLEESFDLLLCIDGMWFIRGNPVVVEYPCRRRLIKTVREYGEDRITAAKIIRTILDTKTGNIRIKVNDFWRGGQPFPEPRPHQIGRLEDAVWGVKNAGENNLAYWQGELREAHLAFDKWKKGHPNSEWSKYRVK